MKVDFETRPRLISLLKAEQFKRKASLNAFAKALEIQPSWLSRFYNSKDYDPDTKILDKIAEKLGFEEGAEALIQEADRLYKIGYDDLSIGSGLSTWALPLYLTILEGKLPEKVKCISALAATPSIDNNNPDELPVSTVEDLEKMFNGIGAEERLRRSLNASDIFKQLSREIQHFDLAIIPTSLRDDLRLNGIYQLASLAKGYGVFIYIISRKEDQTRHWKHILQAEENSTFDVKELQRLIETIIDEISEIVLLPQTAAYQQWEEFCKGLFKKDKELMRKLAATVVEYKSDSTYNSQSHGTVILCAFEPFANTFFHAYYGKGYEYACINLSKIINREIEMAVLSNKATLDNVEKLKIIFSLLEPLRKMKPIPVKDDVYDLRLDRLARAIFIEESSDKSPIERLYRSIKDMDYVLTETDLADYLFEDINPK